MKLLKLTAFSSILFSFLVSMNSCEKDEEKNKVYVYVKSGIAMTGAQETPAVATSGSGTLDVSYDKRNKVLNYKFRWSGLTGPVTAFHIHGLAPVGYGPAAVVQTFVTSSIVPCTTGGPTSCGSYSGTFQVDGIKVKEEDILNGFYYVNIHTTANPGGEIRGQVVFQ